MDKNTNSKNVYLRANIILKECQILLLNTYKNLLKINKDYVDQYLLYGVVEGLYENKK